MSEFSDSQLEAYLDEALPVEEMTAVETALRDEPLLRDRLCEILQRRDAGVHTLGTIWRRHRLSCPSRKELAAYLHQTLTHPLRDYVHFHVHVVGCRYCQANLDDLAERTCSSQDIADLQSRLYASGRGLLREQRKR